MGIRPKQHIRRYKSGKEVMVNYGIIKKPAKQMYGYIGMNKSAAKELGYPWQYKKDVIVIDKNLTGREKERTIVHEAVENEIMKATGKNYWDAHKIAMKAEKEV